MFNLHDGDKRAAGDGDFVRKTTEEELCTDIILVFACLLSVSYEIFERCVLDGNSLLTHQLLVLLLLLLGRRC
jgi:hypothetical protein